MTSQEAATYLGISVRSLQRYVRSGRLKVRYEPGRTRPVPLYENGEIETLKAELYFRPVFPQSRSTQEPKRGFGLRLSPAALKQLTLEAAQYGMRPSEYGRHLIQMGLEGALQGEVEKLRSEVVTLGQKVAALQQALRDFQTDVRETTEIVLEYSGMAAQDARQWVEENLHSP